MDIASVWANNIETETRNNANFRTVLWTGQYCQLTVMSIAPGENIGWEMHHDVDQFLCIERGQGRLDTGSSGDSVEETRDVSDDWAVVVPAGTWHDVTNTGDADLKLYSVYAPPEHPKNTVHTTKAESEAGEAGDHA